jgi:hypothetical protein
MGQKTCAGFENDFHSSKISNEIGLGYIHTILLFAGTVSLN